MEAPPALGNDVIDVFGGPAAVLALEVIAHEDRSPGQRRARAIGHFYEVVKPDDAGGCEGQLFRVEDVTVGMDDLGFPLKREYDCPPYRHNAQGLVGRVQNQRSSQLAKSIGGPEPNVPTPGPGFRICYATPTGTCSFGSLSIS